ncbi:MAG: T9SS type A sorting domain-containing protein [Ignavibacteriales bacterium]|nr:T9SS type A sorting domain-containing protein [Ignavibacteriales bacterium]
MTNTNVQALAVSETILFAGTYGGGVFRSTNNGTSWTEVNSGLTDTEVYALAVSGTNLFAGTLFGGVFLSTNNGTSWNEVNNGLANTDVKAFAVSGTSLFAGTNYRGVFFSINNGTNWTAVNSGLTDTDVYALAVSGTNLFAGTWGGGVFLSTNNGTSWTGANNGLTNLKVNAFAVSGANLFAGTEGGGVFLSTNNGSNWTEVNNGLTNSLVLSLAVSSSNLFAGTGNGVFLSTNNGTNWTAINNGLSMYVSVYTLAVSGTNLFAGTGYHGVFLSTNNGTSWTAVNSGLTNLLVNALAVSPNGAGGANLFAGTGGGVFLSTNNGTSWTEINNGLTNTYVLALSVSGANLFAGTYHGGVWKRPLDEMIPVELTSFTASVGENKVLLNWATATETNNQGFEIERKLFGSNYEKIGYITGFGTTTEPKSYSFTDQNVTSGKYSYRLKQIDFDGTFEYSNTIEVEISTPLEFSLEQNYPNPFNPTTTITFSIPEKSFVTLKVYDILGREIAVLVNEELETGNFEKTFEASTLSSGVYIYRITTMKDGKNLFNESKQMMLIK